MSEGDQHRHSRRAPLLAVAFLGPLLALPLYLVGNRVADGLDGDRANGIFALGLILGVAGPAALTIWFGRARAAAVALGAVSGALSLVVLFAAFTAYCTGRDC